jgi:hypothetical protein
MGNWKLIEWFETGRLELYDLSQDIGEKNDLSKTNPKELAKLHAAMKSWRKRVKAPIPTTPNPKYDPDAKVGSKKRKRKKK